MKPHEATLPLQSQHTASSSCWPFNRNLAHDKYILWQVPSE
jgi:hypothetical protein